MNTENPNKYIIIYSNHFVFNGRVLAFRKKELFDITEQPIHIPFNLNTRCWIVNRKQLTAKKAARLVKFESKQVDISHLQWYIQIELDECFNLEKHK